MKNNAIICLTDIDYIFSGTAVAHLARISVELLRQCEQEELFSYASGDRLSFSPEEITQLSRIRRLHEDLGLDLPAIGIVLNMRQRILELMAELEETEHQMVQREQALLSEIHRLQSLIARDLDFDDT